MDWNAIGARVRKQREYLGYTREQFAERLGVTPKFCSDIELGVKGMSVPTLCKISGELRLSADYILFGKGGNADFSQLQLILNQATAEEKEYAEQILKTFFIAMNSKKDSPQ